LTWPPPDQITTAVSFWGSIRQACEPERVMSTIATLAPASRPYRTVMFMHACHEEKISFLLSQEKLAQLAMMIHSSKVSVAN